MQNVLRVFSVTVLVAMTAGCGSVKDELGLEKKAPDEFTVVRNAPLSLPPNYNLRPPKPGENGAGQQEQREKARTLLTGRQNTLKAKQDNSSAHSKAGSTFLAGRSDNQIGEIKENSPAQGEQALLSHLDATNADPNIRQKVDQEANILASDDRGFVEKLMFWRKQDTPGTVVDAEGEAKRLKENTASGKPPTDGETPVIRIERSSSGGIRLF
ncbi:MAG: DUF3035 domain-containing protein [Rhodospirillales bacterium]